MSVSITPGSLRARNLSRLGRVPLLLLGCFTLTAGRSALAQSWPTVRWQAGGHANGTGGITFSPDGLLAASASNDSTAKLWRVADGQLLHTFTTGGLTIGTLHSVMFSPDNADLLFTGTGGAYRVRLSDGALTNSYCCLETGYATAFSPDGQYLAVGGSESGLEEATLLVRLADNAIVHTFIKNVQHYVFSVAFTPDSQYLITGSGSAFSSGNLGVIRYWRIADGVEVLTINAHNKRVLAIDVSPDGTLIASAAGDGQVKLWDLATGTFVRQLDGHTGEVYGVKFSPHGDQLASCGQDGTVRVWQTDTGEQLYATPAHTGSVGGVDWSPSGKQLLSGGGKVFGSGDAAVRVWNADSGTPVQNFTQYTATQEAVATSPVANLVATGGYDGVVVLRDATTGTFVRSMPSGGAIISLAFAPDGATLASGSWDRTLRLFDVATGALLHTLPGYTSAVEGLAISPDGTYVAGGDWDGPVMVWRIADGAPIATYAADNIGGRALAFAPDGQVLAVAGSSGVQLRSFPAGAVVRTLAGPASGVQAIAFAPDGNEIATGSGDHTVRTWDPVSGALRRTFTGHAHTVQTVAYGADGRLLLSAGEVYDRTVRLWNPRTGANIAVYNQETGSGVLRAAALPQRGFAYVRRDGTAVAIEPPPPTVTGDWDYDGVITVADVVALPSCVSGPGGTAAWYAPSADCGDAYDFDTDADVDLVDLAALQVALGA